MSTALVTFRAGAARRLGVLLDDGIIDANLAYAELLRVDGHERPREHADAVLPADALSFLQEGARGRSALDEVLDRLPELAGVAGVRHARGDVTLLPPIVNPPKVVCVARNYGKHASEAGKELSEIPILFARFANTLIADGVAIEVPTVSEQLDWEGELAVVIGRPGRHVTREDALAHVAGYAIFNDVTVRDYQFRVAQYTAGKNFATSGPFGPAIVLADGIPDPHDLRIVTRVNDEVVQDGNTSEMIFDIPAIIEHISEFIDLEVGDVIPMGTPAGVGFTRTPPRFLRAGDTITVSIDGLGTLANPVINERTS